MVWIYGVRGCHTKNEKREKRKGGNGGVSVTSHKTCPVLRTVEAAVEAVVVAGRVGADLRCSTRMPHNKREEGGGWRGMKGWRYLAFHVGKTYLVYSS